MSNNIVIHSSLALTPTELLQKGFQVPSGTVIHFGGATAPTGWLICDGSSLIRADFPALFAAIGTAHGAVDASHFNLPDSRGKFIRGVDGVAGNDPDKASRTAAATGGNTGNLVGSVQADDFKSHVHGPIAPVGGVLATGSGGTGITSGTTSATGGNETRPKNLYLQPIIKY